MTVSDGDDYVETKWTQAARDAYIKRAEELTAALRAHVELVLTRTGRKRELPTYFDSADALHEAARAFNDAECDWCGSIPLGLSEFDEEDGEDEELEAPEGAALTLVGRWDFRVTDPEAFVEAGRSTYLASRPHSVRDDAELEVQSVVDAAGEVLHRGGPDALEMADGLDPERATLSFILHDGGDDEEFETDPFAIARRDGGMPGAHIE